MELKLTTVRALAYEKKTGQDILNKVQQIAKDGFISLKDTLDLFEALGEDNTVEKFDAWDAPLADKMVAIVDAVREYIEGKK